MGATQLFLTGLVLAGGIGMLINMVGWANNTIGMISAAVAVAGFALMAIRDMRAMNKSKEQG